MIGLGTQASIDDARAFRRRGGIESFRLWWEDGLEAWDHFGVRSQPVAMLLDRDGRVVDAWAGELDEAAFEDILGQAAELR